jgi:hypothetical protein
MRLSIIPGSLVVAVAVAAESIALARQGAVDRRARVDQIFARWTDATPG